MNIKTKFYITQAFLISFLMFLIISVSCDASYINILDKNVFELIGKMRNLYINNFFLVITLFGETLTITIVLAALWLFPNRKKLAFPLTATVIVSAILNTTIKLIIKKPRPLGEFVGNLFFNYQFPSSYTFPSGHAQTSLVFYVILTFLILEMLNVKNKKVKIFCYTLSCVLVGLIGLSRIVLGVHNFSDVLTGYIIGVIIILSFVFIKKMYLEFCIKNKKRV